MTARALLEQLTARGLSVELRSNGSLYLTPKASLTPELLEAVRQQKPALLAYLRGERCVTSNSRNPIIEPEICAKIEAIEADARAKGWPAELLWNNSFWDYPRGLAAALNEEDEIVEVTGDAITILKSRRHLQPFLRRVA